MNETNVKNKTNIPTIFMNRLYVPIWENGDGMQHNVCRNCKCQQSHKNLLCNPFPTYSAGIVTSTQMCLKVTERMFC